MCGIAGVYHFKNSKKIKDKDLKGMSDTLIHRGPDDEGLFISKSGKVGLASRRLKILDLSSHGHMPMERKSACITYNGEIYNFQEVRSELEKKGYKFKSSGDTEVILSAYLEYGPECVNRFNGMFAFAIWDEDRKALFVARDHMGIKPFYYAIQNGSFFFGSEIKAILAHPDFKKDLDEEGLSYYLTFSSSPAPHTLFKDIQKLPAAHYLFIKDSGDIENKEYWNPVTKTGNKTEEEYIGELRSLLKDSIKSQMVSDVPFGCFLSGGVDSSLNAALMSEALGKPVETFSVGSESHERYNEFEYSRMLAKKLGANTHEILINESHLREFLPKYGFFADDPNGDPVCLPLFWLSKLAKDNGVTVVQIGEGSDELFLGYELYRKANKLHKSWWSWLDNAPGFIKGLPYEISRISNHPKLEFGKEYMRRLAQHQEPFWGTAIAFGDHSKTSLMTPELKRVARRGSYRLINNYYREMSELDNSADFLKRLSYLEVKHRLPEFLLMRADKMTMAHSVEGRVPFLDKRLVELAFEIPSHMKVTETGTKNILKKAAQGIIPEEIIWRKKQGFGTPIKEWLMPDSPVSRELEGIIFKSKLRERKLLNYDYVDSVMGAHAKGVDQTFKLWNLVTLSLWYDHWFA